MYPCLYIHTHLYTCFILHRALCACVCCLFSRFFVHYKLEGKEEEDLTRFSPSLSFSFFLYAICHPCFTRTWVIDRHRRRHSAEAAAAGRIQLLRCSSAQIQCNGKTRPKGGMKIQCLLLPIPKLGLPLLQTLSLSLSLS